MVRERLEKDKGGLLYELRQRTKAASSQGLDVVEKRSSPCGREQHGNKAARASLPQPTCPGHKLATVLHRSGSRQERGQPFVVLQQLLREATLADQEETAGFCRRNERKAASVYSRQ